MFNTSLYNCTYFGPLQSEPDLAGRPTLGRLDLGVRSAQGQSRLEDERRRLLGQRPVRVRPAERRGARASRRLEPLQDGAGQERLPGRHG